MLSGLMPPTSGDALVFGQSILNAMPAIRATLGVCPQHNILFPLLTVKEHLQLYAAIKGVERGKVDEVVLEMIKQVGLEEKVNVRSHALSGGMQRKLSVAIALIGDSRIVFLDGQHCSNRTDTPPLITAATPCGPFSTLPWLSLIPPSVLSRPVLSFGLSLSEPTSGMDPYSRRATWDMLKKKKEGRVIILTSQHSHPPHPAHGCPIATVLPPPHTHQPCESHTSPPSPLLCSLH